MQWTDVPHWTGFAVTKDGRIKGPSGRTLKRLYKGSGHPYVTTGPRTCRRNLHVHLAVLNAFRGPRPIGMEGRHLNGDPADCRLSNLAWGDRYEQREDDRRSGVVRRPADLVLDESKVVGILQLKGFVSSRFVGGLFGVSHTTIQKIWRGERWQTVPR